MVQERANEVAKSMRRRLRREIGYYLIILATVLSSVVYPFRPRSLGIAAAMVLVVAGVVATLHRGWRQLAALDLEGPAGNALRRSLHVVDVTMRSYLIAYMLCIFLGAAAVTALVMIWHPGDLRWIVPTLPATALTLAWSYRSGRSYLDRHFGHYRDKLARCLTRLEET